MQVSLILFDFNTIHPTGSDPSYLLFVVLKLMPLKIIKSETLYSKKIYFLINIFFIMPSAFSAYKSKLDK